jgi:hypothetical protein
MRAQLARLDQGEPANISTPSAHLALLPPIDLLRHIDLIDLGTVRSLLTTYAVDLSAAIARHLKLADEMVDAVRRGWDEQ